MSCVLEAKRFQNRDGILTEDGIRRLILLDDGEAVSR